MFVFPHGIHVDRQGNVWVIDSVPLGDANQDGVTGKAHVVVKFSPEGKVLMTLGKPGMAGDPPGHLQRAVRRRDRAERRHLRRRRPQRAEFQCHAEHDLANREVLERWQVHQDHRKVGFGPGGVQDAARYRVRFPAAGCSSRTAGNNRLQILDQEGKFLEEWKQFSRLSGIYIDKNDVLYGADSESNTKSNPGWKRGIRIGSAKDGKIMAFIPDPVPDADKSGTSGAGRRRG